jgi:phosphatidylglycerophosphate synthase
MSGRDLGLYTTKYAVRRLLPSALAAIALWQGWWALVVVGIIGRMATTTLDGHIAEAYGKKTRIGPYVNRVPQEFGDVMLLLALFAHAEPIWVCLVLGCAWLVNGLATLPLLAGGKPQWVGPGGQPDRIAVVMVAAAVAIVVEVPWTWVCMLLVALMALTMVIRIARTTRELTAPAADPPAPVAGPAT